jgi:hypothetical protein
MPKRVAPWWALVWLSSAVWGQSLAWKPPAAQKLSFEAEWRLVHAGDVQVESSGAESLKLELHTAGVVRAFVKVDNVFRAAYGPGWCTAETELTAHEGKRQRETKVRYDGGARKAHYLERDLEKNATVAENTIDIPACVHDVTAGLQRLRELLPQPGASVELPVSDGKKAVMARVEAQRRERVRTPVGEFQAIRYEAFLMSGVLYRRKGRLFVWISEDERRLPVQIRVQMPFYIGTVTLQLEKVE